VWNKFCIIFDLIDLMENNVGQVLLAPQGYGTSSSSYFCTATYSNYDIVKSMHLNMTGVIYLFRSSK
jgi:hypothetical protein